jgi:YmgG-like glycine-zipper protein
MFNMAKQRVFIALVLMTALFFGAGAVQARDTHGADRLVKGAVIGAAVGAVTQGVRGRTQPREILKGAAVGGAVGAAVGAYSDYKQEKDARIHEQRRADYYESRAYNQGYGNRNYRRANRGNYYYNDYAPRRARNGHRHNGRCRH